MNTNYEDPLQLFVFDNSDKLDNKCKMVFEPVNNNFNVLKRNPSLQCLSIQSEKELIQEENDLKDFSIEEPFECGELCLSLYEKSFKSFREEEPNSNVLFTKQSQIETNNNSRDKLEPVRLEKKSSLLTLNKETEDNNRGKLKNLRLKKEIEKLKHFWKGETLNYPFSFKKMWAINDPNQKNGDQYVIKEDDFSNKIISFTDFDL